MPICLKCGRQIETGGEYCEECGAKDNEHLDRLLALSARNGYRPPRRRDNRRLLLGMLAIVVIMFTFAIVLSYSIPTGPEFEKRAQAATCRAHLRQLKRAIVSFYAAEGKYPPSGRVGPDHPLVTDQYLQETPECPSTHHHYIIEQDESGVAIRCDSGLPGHSL